MDLFPYGIPLLSFDTDKKKTAASNRKKEKSSKIKNLSVNWNIEDVSDNLDENSAEFNVC